MGIFRGTGDSEMSFKHMGVGSTVHADLSMVIISTGSSVINMLDTATFTLRGTPTVVEDMHHISENELRQCMSNIGLAFSDFTFDAKGIKIRG